MRWPCTVTLSEVLRGLRRPLNAGEDARSVELAPVGAETAHAAKPPIEVVSGRWKEQLLGLGLLFALVVPSVTILSVVTEEWHTSPAQRGWLILGFGFYIVAALRSLWAVFVRVCEQIFYLRVELRRMAVPTLFEAVSTALAAQAEQLGETCSWDQEAVQEHDKLTGDFAVKLRFWSSRPHALRIRLDGVGRQAGEGAPGAPQTEQRELEVQVEFSPGEDVVCGRESRVERRETIVLFMHSSPNTVLADKALLCRWFEECYAKWVRPLEGIVNVYALQESSTDWVPAWAFERVKPCKSATGTGHKFFLERNSLQKVLADAQLWAGSSLRVYMVTGPPGVGKSEFTIWLAGQLALPVYRLCLTSPRLTDDRLAQLLSQSAVTHNSMLVQVDEFQETVQRWLAAPVGGAPATGVSPGGFCECLQGSTAMGRGIVVLTGTGEIIDEEVRRRLPAVFRRIHREAHLSWMSEADVRSYLRGFLARFVPACSAAEWARWERAFMDGGGPWAGSRPVSVDMLKQFLMRQITEASCSGLGSFVPTGQPGAVEFQVRAERQADFFALVCNAEEAEAFLNGYAPVQTPAPRLTPERRQ